jgi:RHS repeat-associated protein
MRRIIWDGDVLLGEIQVPGADGDNLEADANTTAQQSHDGNTLDATQFFGVVAYTHGLSLDDPLSVTRLNYADAHVFSGGYFAYDATTFHQYQAFSILPMWDDRGTWDSYIFNNTTITSLCETSAPHCVAVQAPAGWSPFAGVATIAPYVWHGSLLFDQNDASKLTFRRNRYYDPMTGRFTQEDPIGLAGGLNLYGFAGGDPVNFSDPFGLCPVMPCRSPDDGMNNRPLPPGVDEKDVTWNLKEGWYDLPDGAHVRPHPEDPSHWDHWEIYEPGKKQPQNYPEKKNKPWPGQKVKPYGDQSGVDPWPLISPYTIKYNLKEMWKELIKSIPSTAPQSLPGPAGFPYPPPPPIPGVP